MIVRPVHHDGVAWGLGMPGNAHGPREERIVGRGLLDGHRRPDVLDRHRVPRGPNRHQGVGRHAPDLLALVLIGGSGPQRRERLAGKPLDGPLMGGAVDPLIRDRGHPVLQPGIERVPRHKPPTGERVALDVLHSALHLALRPRPVRLTRSRRHPVVAREVVKDRVPVDLPLATPKHQRARIVIQTGERHAAEMAEGALMAIQQRTQPLVRIGPDPQPPGIAQRYDKQMDALAPLPEPDAELPKVDLRLFARPGLIAHGRDGRPTRVGPPRADRPTHLLHPAGEAEPLELAMQHHRIPPHFRATLGQSVSVRIHAARPRTPLAWPPLSQPPPAFDGLAIHAQLPRDGLDAFAPRQSGQHLLHRVFL